MKIGRTRLGLALVSAGLGLGLIGVVSFGSFGAAEEAPLTEQVKLGSVEETVLANGVLEPVQLINVGAQVSGQLKVLHVSFGQTVKAGDLIAEIDSVPQVNALRIAQAGLDNARAQHRSRTIQFQQAEKAYQRQRLLAGQKAASTAELEAGEATYKSLEADIEALEARIAQATVEVENAEANLGYTKVRAPISGTVVSVVAKAGQTLNSVQAVPTIVVLAELDTMRVKVQISEADIDRVRQGQDIRFTVMGRPDAVIKASLDAIDPAPIAIANDTTLTAGQVNNQAVYYTGRFTTPNPYGRLRPMMTVSTTIVVGHAENVPLVAWSVLTRRDKAGRYHVKVLTPSGEPTERVVRIGLTDRIHAQVLKGLSVGDRVIVPADGETSNPMEMLGL
ncbi:efflux RND transporter periplasmic adaptor subunit [Rhizobium sp. C4]|uniref:efflux RND transporter periplasmic adaptor subunit n=1 Tax=Rhizobium sp. C4 TaxID=1349800 RepID=UPI001E3A4687|nr:efflux RND transporter periplasmic adaptor subunit [Rhizobium sp. C4]MCD2174416.1 efflux RND transporter periplasmic adaptor subunit [Rhizobium sp. C4]